MIFTELQEKISKGKRAKKANFCQKKYTIWAKSRLETKNPRFYGFWDFRRQVKKVAEMVSKTLDLAINP